MDGELWGKADAARHRPERAGNPDLFGACRAWVDVLLAILLAVRGDWLAVLMVLAVAAIGYWFICRQLVAVVSADCAAAVSGILLFLCALSDFATDHPYYGLLFTIGALALAFVFVLLRQGAVPAELRVGGIPAVGAPNRAAHRRMLRELRDAGILTEDESPPSRRCWDCSSNRRPHGGRE